MFRRAGIRSMSSQKEPTRERSTMEGLTGGEVHHVEQLCRPKVKVRRAQHLARAASWLPSPHAVRVR